MERTKEQLFEMYKTAAELREEGDGSFRAKKGERLSREEVRGSAEFAGFIDAVLGNEPRYMPPRGTTQQAEIEKDWAIDMVRVFAKIKDDYNNVVDDELWEAGKRQAYLSGYNLGLGYNGVQQITPPRECKLPTSQGRLEEMTENRSADIVSLADFRERKR